ncbi:MAG: NUDIX hydrolase N-terminal domain-containing protein [Alphaproteobacteria bacterium]|nr:NUDIX hydrolase N-terminal domain-containing protein [Alphaproteobacteria bacterium]MDE2495907.1 NUDIX hydrolase N-terminal domain-containing protein [Alphaproteobacteria bacterium]
MQPKWLLWARELQAAAQSGLTYTENPYDRSRYEAMQALAARIMAEGSDADMSVIEGLFNGQAGYATPKVDVRGAIFRERSVLLVSEMLDQGRWTMPGGFADVNEAPSESVVREVAEEAGYVVTARKLAAVYDRDRHGHPHPHPFHIYKLFFICDIVDECEKSELETGDVRFFPLDALPELSLPRVLPWQIHRMYEHLQDPSLPTDFD